jgi:hypothetical protein
MPIPSVAEYFAACGVAAPPAALQVIQAHALNPFLVHDEFNEANFVTLPASAPFTRIVSVQVPQGRLGLLNSFFVAVANFADWDFLTFQLRVSQAGHMSFDEIQGPMSDIVRYRQTFVPLLTGATIEIVVSSVLALPIPFVTAGLIGRFFQDSLPVEAARLAAVQGG